ncbi:MAG: CvpA family protein [Planctomycetota bacterium]|nr:CvpA family protein [Planctomycetota bacterium]
MASLLVLLIILGCAAYQYFKGNLIKAFVTIVIVIYAGTSAFGFFELLANVFISRGEDSSYASVVPWAQMICFLLLFVVVFAILQTASARLIRHPIDLGFMPERIGRPICGILLGLFLSGVLLAALAMAPLSSRYPYQRFDAAKPNPESASGVLFNVDDFVTGWFDMLSGGTFSGDTSFAAVHPDFISQLYLTRHSEDKNVDVVTTAQAIEVPPRKAVWPAPDVLKDADDLNNTISARGGHNLMIVRMGLKKNAIKESAGFTLSQIRVICKSREDAKDPLKGKGRNIYPLGYLAEAGQMKKKGLKDTVTFKRDEFGDKSKLVDFVFEVPNDYIPVLIEYKHNNIASLPSPVTAEQAMSEETAAVPAKETTENLEKKEKGAEKPNP